MPTHGLVFSSPLNSYIVPPYILHGKSRHFAKIAVIPARFQSNPHKIEGREEDEDEAEVKRQERTRD